MWQAYEPRNVVLQATTAVGMPDLFTFLIFTWLHQGLAVACTFLVVVCGIWFPDQGSNLGPLHWEHGVLAIASPGKSLECLTYRMALHLISWVVVV